ncbi:NAD(P)/FAD-dependent oxidoreductase [Paralcaligenes ureilyticus]|uniref:Glycine/D-amino acid oxidase-like deaminating enzyme n=1 Tax=Paralcaligenes ureilyticus TaxID=627131 RepID=A0A4R3MC10_9BURK|nr:FAD-dependent oxidoreductase [Paralcaligenes ureilyticus]TCT11080.1 glycine/D-amino acid oxidase-like deaminating enzyme [Paralcaligenes ureilyticus]
MTKLESYDVIVIGAGMVGAAIAYGLAGRGRDVLVLDGADTDYRAAKANFGLVWVQGKGYDAPAYQKLSRHSVRLWPEFALNLEHETGVALDYENRGGLHFCLGEQEWAQRRARLDAWHVQAADEPPYTRMLDREQLQAMLPGVRLGPDVSGASLGKTDGHVNPLKLLIALHKGLMRRGATILGNRPATGITALTGGGFSVTAGGERYEGAQVVIAAGLGSASLGRMVGLDVPLRPQRGQLLVTERLRPLLPLPASGIRQTAEGTVMIGVTQENVGYDLHTTSSAAARMTHNALRILPDLAQARLVRHWSCLRILTPDGCPVYAGSISHPGAWIAVCHSGVTLAAFHAGPLSDCLHDSTLTANLDFFHHERFDVSTTA